MTTVTLVPAIACVGCASACPEPTARSATAANDAVSFFTTLVLLLEAAVSRDRDRRRARAPQRSAADPLGSTPQSEAEDGGDAAVAPEGAAPETDDRPAVAEHSVEREVGRIVALLEPGAVERAAAAVG